MITRAWSQKIVTFTLMCVMSSRALGVLFAPVLLDQSPLLYLLICPMIPVLVAVSVLISPLQFWVSAVMISLFHVTSGFMFGRRCAYETVQEWTRGGSTLQRLALEGARRGSWLVVLLVPGPLVAAITGAVSTSPRLTLAVLYIAQALWVTACWSLGVSLEAHLLLLRAWVSEHLFALSALSFAAFIALKLRASSRSEDR